MNEIISSLISISFITSINTIVQYIYTDFTLSFSKPELNESHKSRLLE